MTITVHPWKPEPLDLDTVASLAVASLIRAVQHVDRAMSEGVDAKHPDLEWPDSGIATSCDYAIRLCLKTLYGIVGRSYEVSAALEFEIQHVGELLLLINACAPNPVGYVHRLLDSAIRTYDVLTDILQETSAAAHRPKKPDTAHPNAGGVQPF